MAVCAANKDAHSLVRLNGSVLELERELCHGDRLILGERLAFRFNEPYGSEQARNLDWGFAQRVRRLQPPSRCRSFSTADRR